MAKSKNTKYSKVRGEALDEHIDKLEVAKPDALNNDTYYFLCLCERIILAQNPHLKSVSLQRLKRAVRNKDVPSARTSHARRRLRELTRKAVPTDPAVLELRDNHRRSAPPTSESTPCADCGETYAHHLCPLDLQDGRGGDGLDFRPAA